jgi:hypothetical protein
MMLKPGQQLYLKKSSDLSIDERGHVQRLRISRGDAIWVTLVNESGISIQINRYPNNIIGFIPKEGVGMMNWTSFFEAGDSINPSFVEHIHSNTLFPTECN